MKKQTHKSPHKNADEYIAAAPVEKRPMLEKLRHIIKQAAPNAEEVISYHVVCYKYYGMLIGFGARKIGCSLYTMSTTLPKQFSKTYPDLDYSYSTIHFSLNKPLPAAMIKKIVKIKVKMNEEKEQIKRLAKAAK